MVWGEELKTGDCGPLLRFGCGGEGNSESREVLLMGDLTLFLSQWKCSNLKEETEYRGGVIGRMMSLSKARGERARNRVGRAQAPSFCQHWARLGMVVHFLAGKHPRFLSNLRFLK